MVTLCIPVWSISVTRSTFGAFVSDQCFSNTEVSQTKTSLVFGQSKPENDSLLMIGIIINWNKASRKISFELINKPQQCTAEESRFKEDFGSDQNPS